MVISTQVRQKTEVIPCQWYASGNKLPMDSFANDYYAGGQITTSYRSKDRVAGDPESDFVQTSGSRAAFMQELRSMPYDGPGRTSYDNGHEFDTTDYTIRYLNQKGILVRNPGPFELRYEGNIVLNGASVGWPSLVPPSSSKVTMDGTRAIAMLMPNKPEAGLAQFVGELREKLPALIGVETYKKGLSTKTIGSEYLNVEFGLKPFISDLEKLARSVLEVHKLVSQYKRDSGRNIRRRALLRDDTDFRMISSNAAMDISLPRRLGSEPNLDTYVTVESRRLGGEVFEDSRELTWFSGAFTYHLSDAHNFITRIDQWEEKANHLLGTRITPELVWELTPWSWLVDWFANVGNFLTNVDMLSNDASVLRYGYVMHYQRVSRTCSRPGLTPVDGVALPAPLRQVFEITRKQRTRATPYGFGVDVGALSPRRWAILGALGMTKGPGNLGL